jgi:TRAP-type C4-dicarboxylate transport system permease small subunit
MRILGNRINLSRGYTAATRAFLWLAAGSVFVLMLFITGDVSARYLFNNPLPGSYEIPRTLMVVLVCFALAHTEMRKINIRVATVLNLLSPKWQAALDFFTYLLGVILFGSICWLIWPWAWQSWISKDYMEGPLRLVFYPAKFTAAIGFSLLSIEFIVELFESLIKLFTAKPRNELR